MHRHAFGLSPAIRPWLLRLLTLVGLLIGAFEAVAAPSTLEIRNASLRPLDGAGEAQPVSLPDAWNSRGRSGTWEYQIEFDVLAAPNEPWGVYLPRAGNRLAVSLNGRLIGRLGGFEGDRSDHAQRPHFFFLPPEGLHAGRNDMVIAVQGEAARYAGLSAVTVGPAAAVRPAFVVREVLQVWGSFAIVAVALVFGLIALALTLGSRSRDRALALFAAACLLCAFRTSYALVVVPPLDYRLWTALVDAAYVGYLVCLCLFCVEVLRLQRRWIGWATGALMVAALVLLPLHAIGRAAPARQALLSGMVVYALALCLLVIVHWWRTRTPESRILAAAGAASVALAVHDHVLVFYTAGGYGSFALARFSLIAFVVAMGWLLVDRQARHASQEARLRRELDAELQRKRLELQEHFEREQELIADGVQQRERQRLLQDLHDGMGLQLNALLGMVRAGTLHREELTREVHTTIEQMRMLMDSTEAFDGDVSMLLGHIRHRIEHRLRREGVRLEWDMRLDLPRRVLPAAKATALQRLVFELATNTLKHAQARGVRVSARDDSQGNLLIEYADDGRGFSADQVVAGVGTRSIARRADDLVATLRRDSAPGRGVRYALCIPPASFAAEPGGVAHSG
jgi:hypothetical protein